jgi:hypothetical protein
MITGMAVFVLGFAVAAGLVLAGASGGPAYLVAVTAGLVGVGVIGVFAGRGTTPMPASPLYAPATLRALCLPLRLPAPAVTGVLYALAGFGVLGNIAVPVLLHR